MTRPVRRRGETSSAYANRLRQQGWDTTAIHVAVADSVNDYPSDSSGSSSGSGSYSSSDSGSCGGE